MASISREPASAVPAGARVGNVAPPLTRPTRRAGRWFHVGVAILAWVLSLAAFAPSIVNPSLRRGPVSGLVWGHAVLMAAWLALYGVQSWLAATGRVSLHRRLGVASIPIASGVVVTGYLVTVAMVRRGYDLSGDLSRAGANALDQAVFQFGALVIFSVLIAAALVARRRPQVHKRLMTLAVTQTLTAPLAHLVGHFQLSGLVMPAWGIAAVVVLLVYDRLVLGRVHPASLWVGIGLVILNNLQFAVIGPSSAWRVLMTWLTR
jgi:hypothetical protein